MSKHNPHSAFSDELIVKFLNREANSEELIMLSLWLSESSLNKRYFDEVCDVWQASARTGEHDFNADAAWKNVHKQRIAEKSHTLVKSEVRPFFIRWQWAAAVVIVSFILGTLTLYFKSSTSGNNQLLYTEHTVPYGSRSQVKLPDGTKVWINSGSRLVYTQNFNSTDREVQLSGEAYFDVTTDPAKPFRVKTTSVTIKVLGTAFNVKAYPEDKTIETTVERGLVQVYGNSSNDPVNTGYILHPNQKAVFNTDRISIDKTAVSGSQPAKENVAPQPVVQPKSITIEENIKTSVETSWKDNRWVFEGETLEAFAVKMERRYNVKIEFADNSLRHQRFSGILEDESLDQVLQVLKLSAPVRYLVNRNTVVLYENKSFINK